MVRSEGNMSLKNPMTPPGIDPGTVRLVAQRLNHYATPGPLTTMYVLKCNDRTNYSPIIVYLFLLKMSSFILTQYSRGVKCVLYFNVCALTNEIIFVFTSGFIYEDSKRTRNLCAECFAFVKVTGITIIKTSGILYPA